MVVMGMSLLLVKLEEWICRDILTEIYYMGITQHQGD